MSPPSSRRDLVATVALLRAELRGNRRENEILCDAAEPLIHQAPARDRCAFIHARRDRFSAKRLCNILITDRSNYHAWVRAQDKRRSRDHDDEEPTRWTTEIHTRHPAYGAERITRELQCQGIMVGRRIVTRLMRSHGITRITRRKRRNPTKPDAVPDPIRREFTTPMPGLKLIGDISCFPTVEGWLYLATVPYLCSKEVVGYALAPHMRASLAVDAMSAAHALDAEQTISRISTLRNPRQPSARTGARSLLSDRQSEAAASIDDRHGVNGISRHDSVSEVARVAGWGTDGDSPPRMSLCTRVACTHCRPSQRSFLDHLPSH